MAYRAHLHFFATTPRHFTPREPSSGRVVVGEKRVSSRSTVGDSTPQVAKKVSVLEWAGAR